MANQGADVLAMADWRPMLPHRRLATAILGGRDRVLARSAIRGGDLLSKA